MDSIEEKVVDIFKNRMFRDLSKCNNPFSLSIFGTEIGLQPSEAMFLLFELEKEFGIRFSDNVVTEYKFSILGDIVQAIKDELSYN